ncbi:hypothetical protein BFJ70_g16979 [Fusarium oxysporum]|nr:hypothetical protein BFJ70_g16979 [Fusarium oxysporum]
MDHYASNSEPVPVHRSFQKTASSRKPSTYIFDAHGQTALILDTFKAQPFNWETETIWLGKDRASVRNAKKKKLEEKARKKALTPVPQPLALPESPVSTSLSDMEIADPISAGLNVTRDKHLQFLNGPEKKPGYMNAETDADSPNLQMQNWEYGERSGILRD